AWHGMRHYYDRPRDRVGGEDYGLVQGELHGREFNLEFRGPAASLAGRLVDEAGRPVANAQVRIASCDYLDVAGKEEHLNFREFWAIRQAPAALTAARTDADGRFRLDGLPPEAVCTLAVEHPDFAYLNLLAATSGRPAQELNAVVAQT